MVRRTRPSRASAVKAAITDTHSQTLAIFMVENASALESQARFVDSRSYLKGVFFPFLFSLFKCGYDFQMRISVVLEVSSNTEMEDGLLDAITFTTMDHATEAPMVADAARGRKGRRRRRKGGSRSSSNGRTPAEAAGRGRKGRLTM